MIQPQDIFDYRDIIVPVIGDNCFVYNSGNGEIPLQEFIVNTLTDGKMISEDLLAQMKTRGYYGLTLLKKHCYPYPSKETQDSKFKLGYKRAIEGNKSNIHLNEMIKAFLQSFRFPVIVTTNCFKLIESELPFYESVSFPSLDGNRENLNKNQNTVYHIFGLEANGAEWVTGEEQLLSFVHRLHGDGATDLKNFINANNNKKALFVIGSNLPDWLFRFFLYPITDIANNRVGYFLSSSNKIEDSLANFLEEISYDYDVNEHLEDVLQQAIALFPSPESKETNNRRVPHNKEYDIFISYASENNDIAFKIRDVLHNKYNLNVWLDTKQIVDGNYEKRIIDGINNSAYFMPIVTKEYIMKHSLIGTSYKDVNDIVNDKNLKFVQKETLIAENQQKKLQRIAYSLPVVIPSPIGDNGFLDISLIENNLTKSCVLPDNLFRKQHMMIYEEMFNVERDWAQYKTIEL